MDLDSLIGVDEDHLDNVSSHRDSAPRETELMDEGDAAIDTGESAFLVGKRMLTLMVPRTTSLNSFQIYPLV